MFSIWTALILRIPISWSNGETECFLVFLDQHYIR